MPHALDRLARLRAARRHSRYCSLRCRCEYIPIEEYAKRGVVVFNSPRRQRQRREGDRACRLILSSRGVVQSMQWVRDNAKDPNILVNAEKARRPL